MDIQGFITKDGTLHRYDYHALANKPVASGEGMRTDYDRSVRSVNHQGFSTVAPENTIPAYLLSEMQGFTYVSCDVAFTLDGICVLLHDATIDRTSNGSGRISSMTYEQALGYDFGAWKGETYAGTRIPTLKEFLQVCKGLGLHPYIGIGNESGITQAMVDSIVTAVQATGMKGRVTYISYSAVYLGYVKALDPFARLGYVVETVSSTYLTTAKALRLDTNEVFLHANHGKLTADAVSLCMAADMPLEVWNVNSESWIENMDPYISGVTSDSLMAGKVLYNKYRAYKQPDISTLTGISVTYSGGSVAVGTELAALEGIGVTASYSDGSQAAVTGYTLSGTIAEGENTVTVTYGGKTASFRVTGIAESGSDEPEAPAVPEGYELVRTLYSNELQYKLGSQYQNNTSDPPYTIQNNMRVGYLHQDIPVEYGYSYRVDFVSKYETAQYSMQLITQAGLELMASGAQFSSGGTPNTQVYDSGWLASGEEVQIPEHHNNSPCACMRLAFRMSAQNEAVVLGDIQSVTVSRKPA